VGDLQIERVVLACGSARAEREDQRTGGDQRADDDLLMRARYRDGGSIAYGGNPEEVGLPPISQACASRYRQPVLIPDTVRATVLRRIRRLDRVDRSVVMRASVIGRRFHVAVLTATASYPEARVRAALERACALQLVVEDDSAQERYAFRHALTRDVIYEELLHGRVRPLHRRIARVLERMVAGGDAPLDDLAFHAWAAGDVRRGVRYNELAGDRAAAVHAGDDARTYYGRALGLVPVESHTYARVAEKLRAAASSEEPAGR
jgi:predicted ATPase